MSKKTNYQKGVDAERRAMADLERVGYSCIRASGSHGFADVVAKGPLGTRYIQVKRFESKKCPSYEVELEQLREEICPPASTLEFWIWKAGERSWYKQIVVKRG